MKAALIFAFAFAIRLDALPIESALQADSDDSLSLLQVSAQKHTQEEGDESSVPASDLCRTGIASGRFCCGRSCGSCGGRGCQNRPGGGNSCCTNQITQSGRRCSGRNMQNCLLPRGMGRGNGMGRGMGMGMGYGEEPQVPPTDLSAPSIVEELAVCETSLVFTEVIHSNLGGAGPDGGSEDITFGNVAPNTNLVVTATSPYTPNMLNPAGGVLRNGVRQGFGVINMASGSAVNLDFTLKDSVTGGDSADTFVVTFFDGDHGMAHESREGLTINGMSNYIVDDDTELEITETATDDASLANGVGVATFTSTLRGTKEDNPVSPMALTGLQEQRSVEAYFENKAAFSVTLTESGYVNPQGRNIFFAGASTLTCQKEAKCTSFECPLGWTLKQDAEFVVCASKPCSGADSETCCFEAVAAIVPPAAMGMGMGMNKGMGMSMGMGMNGR